MRMPPAKSGTDTMRIPPGTDPLALASQGPVELPPGTWEAPPVRLPGHAAPSVTDAKTPRDPKRRRARRILVGLGAAVGLAVVVALILVLRKLGRAEESRYDQARAEYQEKNFTEAASRFQALAKDYPGSGQHDAYKFFAELSAIRKPVYSSKARPEEIQEAYQRLVQFAEGRQDSPLLKEVAADLRETFYKLAERLTEAAEQDNDRGPLVLARQALGEARKYGEARTPADKDAAERVSAAEAAFAKQETRQQLLARLKQVARQPGPGAVRAARQLVRQAEREQPGLGGDGKVSAVLDRLMKAHQDRVTYTEIPNARPSPSPAEDNEPSLLVAPAVGGLGFSPWPRQSPMLALARGILYALRPSDGSVRWAARVGADTTTLPLRLPAYKARGELILVLSSDTRTLSALDAADGSARWHHRLTDVCLGRPTLAEGKVYVPCINGRVDEVDAFTGKLRGFFQLGPPLRHGGVYDPDSRLLYLAADSYCVYALDLANKTKKPCAQVLYSEHPSGSLCCPPSLVYWKDVRPDAAPNPNAPRSCLVLSQTDGLEATQLRVFPLPITRSDAAPLRLDLRVRGWSWFSPYQDAEKLALATDVGVVGLFGIRQKNNRDPLLYPMLDREYVLEGGDTGRPPGRSQMVYFDESNFWILAHGQLHRLQLTLGANGWHLARLWDAPVSLGPPLHAAQVGQRPGGRLGAASKVLYFVTQPGGGQICLASAVEAEAEAYDQNKVKWQTQLGLVSQGDPVVLPGAVLVQDQGGGLFRFEDKDDPLSDIFQLVEDLLDIKSPEGAEAAWHIHEQLAARPLKQAGARPVGLLPVAGGAFALVAVGKAPAGDLVVRHFDAASRETTDYPCPLPAPLAGTAGAWPDHLVLPLANGVLVRKTLASGQPVPGPNWRARLADDNAPGHVVPLDRTDFLVTDGSRGLIHLSWPEDNDECQEKARLELSARIVAPPVVLPGEAGAFRVFVADADHQVILLRGDRKGGLEVIRRLTLDGPISTGPFILGKGVGCVTAQRRLVLLDAETNQRVWPAPFEAEADIVGQPSLVGGLVVVADLEGRFVGLDPATGKPRGKGYQLKANVAPACAPVPLGAGRLFAPLTDGTVLLLSRRRLEGRAK
jgi:outer membrane protein assembly factor BamB